MPSPDFKIVDASTWKSALEGDLDARQRLIECAWSQTALRLRTFSPDDRDEIRQEIAESVLRALATGLSPHSNVAAFLDWRGRAQVTEFIRHRTRTRTMVPLEQIFESTGSEVAEGGPTPLGQAQLGELHTMVRDCSERIANPNHKRAWEMRILRGMEPREIAEDCEVSRDVTRAWIARASKVVRRCLELKLGLTGLPDTDGGADTGDGDGDLRDGDRGEGGPA